MSDMKALVENVAKAQAIAEGVRWSTYDKAGDALRKNAIDLRYGSARASVIAVLEHFSDPANIPDDWSVAFNLAYTAYWDKHWTGESHPVIGRNGDKAGIASAFRAARSELDE